MMKRFLAIMVSIVMALSTTAAAEENMNNESASEGIPSDLGSADLESKGEARLPLAGPRVTLDFLERGALEGTVGDSADDYSASMRRRTVVDLFFPLTREEWLFVPKLFYQSESTTYFTERSDAFKIDRQVMIPGAIVAFTDSHRKMSYFTSVAAAQSLRYESSVMSEVIFGVDASKLVGANVPEGIKTRTNRLMLRIRQFPNRTTYLPLVFSDFELVRGTYLSIGLPAHITIGRWSEGYDSFIGAGVKLDSRVFPQTINEIEGWTDGFSTTVAVQYSRRIYSLAFIDAKLGVGNERRKFFDLQGVERGSYVTGWAPYASIALASFLN